MNWPPHWTLAELRQDALLASAAFRHERLDEPLEQYSRFFQSFVPTFRFVIDRLPALLRDESLAAELMEGDDSRAAVRYLGAPPISEDDLKTLAESQLSAKRLRASPDEARRVRDVLMHILDPHRFPWVRDGRPALDHEIEQAVVASAAMIAARRVEATRRNSAKRTQEDLVRSLLERSGYRAVPSRSIPLLDDAPAPGEYCPESKLGDTRADLVVRIKDRRVVAIECKVSNSAVNSYKRVNHEAAGKARQWLVQFGARAVVPVAVLGGVFKPENLVVAQESGLSLFWQHRLSDLSAALGRP